MGTETIDTNDQVANFHQEMKARATQPNDDLPRGSAPVEEPEAEAAEEVTEVAASAEEPQATAAVSEEPETLIKIGEKTFKTQAEAVAYAETLESEKFQSDAYAQGLRDAMDRVGAPAQAAAPPPPEEDFDSQFYANPKEYLTKVKEQAKSEAIAIVSATQNREKLWGDFFREYPDLDGQRQMCEMVLNQNWEVLGKMTDLPKAMKILAQKTRAIFEGYIEKSKPRTQLASAPVRTPAGAPKPSVTPAVKKDEPLDFASQMRSLRKRT